MLGSRSLYCNCSTESQTATTVNVVRLLVCSRASFPNMSLHPALTAGISRLQKRLPCRWKLPWHRRAFTI